MMCICSMFRCYGNSLIMINSASVKAHVKSEIEFSPFLSALRSSVCWCLRSADTHISSFENWLQTFSAILGDFSTSDRGSALQCTSCWNGGEMILTANVSVTLIQQLHTHEEQHFSCTWRTDEVCKEEVNGFLNANNSRDGRACNVQTPRQLLYFRLTTISLSLAPHTSDPSRSCASRRQTSAAAERPYGRVQSQTRACGQIPQILQWIF